MRCSNCGSDNPEALKFCNQCGAPFRVRCGKCAFDNAPGARFCGECGASLFADKPTHPVTTQPDSQDSFQTRSYSQIGERRHLTVLFCDMVGSTELAARLDPEEYQQTLAAYHRAAAEAISRFGGQVAKYLGDGVIAYFGYPAAHDNDAERAVRAGIAMLEAISGLNQQGAANSGQSCPIELSLRIGIDSGAVVVGAGAGAEVDIFGEAPNIAARVQAAAAPDTVFITAATHRLVSGLFVVEDCGAHSLKGIEQPVQLYRVVGTAGVRGRLAAAAALHGLTPFVGREDEMRMLTSRWQRVLDGEGQVVLVVGEAGIGKSRLVHRFRELIANRPHTAVEAAAAPFYQNTPFYPVADLLRQLVWKQSFDRLNDYLLELQNKSQGSDANSQNPPARDPSRITSHASSESADARLVELQSGLARAGLSPAEAMPLIAPLLHVPLSATYTSSSLSPEEQRRRLLATLIEWLLGAARTQPLLLVIEDLHWADPSTLELMQLLFEQGAAARLLLLCTARPEFHPEWPLRVHHTQITLNRLSAQNVREMIGQVAARSALARETLDAVVERTSGVPLFVEELTRAVLESGNGTVVAREIPVTLHDSLMARLDRLGSAKEVLQVGSVIGGEFSYELLHAVHPVGDLDLQRELRRLTDADLLYVRGLPPDATYQFKHALIRDAAYEALLKSRRKELHRLVARTVDEKFGDIKEGRPEVLARHWTEAGEVEPAISEWCRAGATAEARSAFLEALASYHEALALLNLLPESPERDVRELALRRAVLHVLHGAKGAAAPETIDATAHTMALAQKTGHLTQLADVMITRGFTLVDAGDISSASTLADEALALAVNMSDPATLKRARVLQLRVCYYRGDLARLEKHFAEGRYLFEQPGLGEHPSADALVAFGTAALSAWYLGRADTARQRLALMRGRVNKNSYFDTAFVEMWTAVVHTLLREYERAAPFGERALELAERFQFPIFLLNSRVYLGHALAQLGRTSDGVALIRRGIEDTLKNKNPTAGLAGYYVYLAAAQHQAGAIEDALESIEQSLQVHPDVLIARPEALRVRGELRAKKGKAESAKADFRDSIALARSMGAKILELRSTMSLARLLEQQRRRVEARSMLAQIYNWFTEGFDTRDLRDAQTLLDKLSS